MSTEVWFQNSVDFLSFQEKLHRRDQLIWVNKVFHWVLVFAIQFRVSHTGVHHHMNVNLWFVWKSECIWFGSASQKCELFYFTAEILNQLIPQKYLKEYSHQCIIWPLPTAYCSKLSIITHNQCWCWGGGGDGDMGHSTPQMFYFALFFCFLAIPMGSEVLFFPLAQLIQTGNEDFFVLFLVMTTPPPFENHGTATAHNNHDIPHQIYFGYHCPSSVLKP